MRNVSFSAYKSCFLFFGQAFPKNDTFGRKQDKWTLHCILHILHIGIRVGAKFQLKLAFLFFKRNFPKNNIFSLTQIKWTASLNYAYSNLSLCQILAQTDDFDFLDQTCPKRIKEKKIKKFKTEKVNITIEFCILEIVWVPNFNLHGQLQFFGPKLPQNVFPFGNGKSITI